MTGVVMSVIRLISFVNGPRTLLFPAGKKLMKRMRRPWTLGPRAWFTAS